VICHFRERFSGVRLAVTATPTACARRYAGSWCRPAGQRWLATALCSGASVPRADDEAPAGKPAISLVVPQRVPRDRTTSFLRKGNCRAVSAFGQRPGCSNRQWPPFGDPSLIAVAAGTYCGAVPRRTARRVSRPARRAVRRVCRRVIPAVWASASDTGSTVGIAARPNAPTPATVAAFAAASPRRETALRREITPDLISSMTNSRIRTPYAKRFYMNVKLNASMRITLVGAGGKPGWHVKGRAPTWQVRGSIQNGSFRLRQNRPARHRYCPVGRSQRLSNTFFARPRSTCGAINFSYA
jgi:hypothetical protein